VNGKSGKPVPYWKRASHVPCGVQILAVVAVGLAKP
jgi:hypothetical protein